MLLDLARISCARCKLPDAGLRIRHARLLCLYYYIESISRTFFLQSTLKFRQNIWKNRNNHMYHMPCISWNSAEAYVACSVSGGVNYLNYSLCWNDDVKMMSAGGLIIVSCCVALYNSQNDRCSVWCSLWLLYLQPTAHMSAVCNNSKRYERKANQRFCTQSCTRITCNGINCSNTSSTSARLPTCPCLLLDHTRQHPIDAHRPPPFSPP